ncbi:Snf7-domain-containing protein [Choiromyces venosus 120613-1]|uniref:Snf7-domain-containing protein n=1 Tax=Choiromyces venosus 120613-1 TaxID=1336337 RepID=A0A3N4JCH4_9PEZI|nr:Snf7-domain-containing protein [Choiromyces venosus 120613-1]
MGNSSSRITAQDRAILNMKLQRDKLHIYQKKIQTILTREHEIAKECVARDDKSRALLALRRRKYQEQLLIKTDAQLEALEKLTSTIEFSLVEKAVLYGLQQGNQVLKEIHKEMSLEAVERLIEETDEARAYQREVSNLLAGVMTNEEEDAVEDELEALEREVLGARAIPAMPDAPSTVPVSPEAQEAEEEEGSKETEAEKKARRSKERAKARRETSREGMEPMLA